MAWAHAEMGFAKIKRNVVAEFFRKILRKKDFMIMVVGDKGSGKSLTVGSLCEMIDPTFCKEDVISDITKLKERLREKIEIGNEIGVMNLDDFGSELDPNEFLGDMARETSHLIQKSRTFHVGFFITVPDRALINKTMRDRLSNYTIEVLGHSEKSGYAAIKMFKLDTNKRSGKVYYSRLAKTPTGEITSKRKKEYQLVSLWMIPKPSKHFLDWYLPFRSELALKELNIVDKPKGKTYKTQIGFTLDDIKKDVEMIMGAGDKYILKTTKGTRLQEEIVMSEYGFTKSRVSAISDYMKSNKLIGAAPKVDIMDISQKILENKDRYVRELNGGELLNKENVEKDFGISKKKREEITTNMRRDGLLRVANREDTMEYLTEKVMANKSRYIKIANNREVLNHTNLIDDFSATMKVRERLSIHLRTNGYIK